MTFWDFWTAHPIQVWAMFFSGTLWSFLLAALLIAAKEKNRG